MAINYDNMPHSIKHMIRDEEPKEDSLPVIEGPIGDFVAESNNDKNAPVKAAAERFVDLVKNGVPPSKAAERIGTTVKDIASNVAMKAAVEDLMFTAELAPEVRRRMVKAGLNKLFMRTVDSDEPKMLKIALEAAKQIGQDPEVGTQQPEGGITFDFGDLKIVKDKGVSLPGIEGPKNETQN